MPKDTKFTADVVLLSNGHVLLIERGWDPYAGRWALPGGHVDPGETSLQAAVRELEEEAGIRLEAADLREVGTFDAPGRDPRGPYSTAAYSAVVPELVVPTAGDDASAARWWALEALPPLAFDHADIITAARRGES